MACGSTIETLDTLVKFTMSEGTAKTIKRRFTEMSAAGEGVSYLDCVLFDAALEALGEEQAYYGMSDDEWEAAQRANEATERRCRHVIVVDVTNAWRGLLD